MTKCVDNGVETCPRRAGGEGDSRSTMRVSTDACAQRATACRTLRSGWSADNDASRPRPERQLHVAGASPTERTTTDS